MIFEHKSFFMIPIKRDTTLRIHEIHTFIVEYMYFWNYEGVERNKKGNHLYLWRNYAYARMYMPIVWNPLIRDEDGLMIGQKAGFQWANLINAQCPMPKGMR